jgi:hypothetical protein
LRKGLGEVEEGEGERRILSPSPSSGRNVG